MRTFKQKLWVFGFLAIGALALVISAVVFLHDAAPPQGIPNPPPKVASAGSGTATVPLVETPIGTASIAQIDARRDGTPALFHLDVDPSILVLDFPDLHPQAEMLNRIAALIEKADMPRDHVVTEAELDAHIQAAGGSPDSYYYGHDYRAADLARFFGIAGHEKMPLNPYETWLRDRLAREGWFKDEAIGALISIPGVSGDIDPSSRTTIFRHELSHAVYFTDPAYVTLTQHFWNDVLTEKERDAMRAFLRADGYDSADEDLMANEAQAYLIHTRDPRYFMPAMVGIDPAREAMIRANFINAIPEPWLRQSALSVAPLVPAAVLLPDAPNAVNAALSSAPARPLPHEPPADAARPTRSPDHQ